MKKILALFALLCVAVIEVSAIPAYPHPIEYQLPDGSTVTVRLYGDEFFSYMLTSDGYHLTELADGFLYYYTPGIETKGAVAVRASDPRRRTAAERSYVNSLRSGVDNNFLEMGRQAAEIRRATMTVNKEGEFAPFMSRATKNSSTRALAASSLVVLCQYKDVKFQASSTKKAFENMLNQKGYSVNGAIGSARDYFSDNSFGVYAPTFDVSEIVTLDNDMKFYGEQQGKTNDIRPREMIREACVKAAAAGTNFAKYDYDNDGNVDNVFVFYAGYNQAEGGGVNTIWPHRWVLYPGPGATDQRVTLNGKVVDDYACTSELKGAGGLTLCGIGTFVHEYGHVLGLPDFYDTDYEVNGEGEGLYDISVMCAGGYNDDGNTPVHYNGLERYMVGWNEMKDIKNAPEKLKISPINLLEGNDVWKIETGNPGEYFYLEARQSSKWDKSLSVGGLLIYHIDRSKNPVGGASAASRWESNSLNTIASHQCARIIESVGGLTQRGNHGNMFYPGSNGKTTFLPGNYGFKAWGGALPSIGLSGITQTDGTVQLRVVKELDLTVLSGTVTDAEGMPIVGVKVSIVEVDQDISSSTDNVMRFVAPSAVKATTRADISYSASTDASGKYTATNIPYGNYRVTYVRDNYDSHVEMLEANTKAQTIDVTLRRFTPELLSQIKWWTTGPDSYLDMNQSIWVAAKWDAADLISVVGRTISGVSVETGAVTSYDLRLLINSRLIYNAQGTTVAAGRTIIYLPSSLNQVIGQSDRAVVEFKVESAKTSIGIDAGPAVKGKSDLYSFTGNDWKRLSDEGKDANFMISLLYKKDSDMPEIPMVKTTPSQRQCSMQFSSVDGNISQWEVRYKAAGGDWTEVKDIKTAAYVLTNLAPETTYQAELFAIFGDKKSAAKTFEFTTEGLSAPFAAIGGVKSRYAVGESYILNSVNIQKEVASIEWRWNASVIRGSELKFAAAGKGRLDCVITYKDGHKEVLSRQIVVQ